jgi:hypothetical protein
VVKKTSQVGQPALGGLGQGFGRTEQAVAPGAARSYGKKCLLQGLAER